MAGAPFPLPAHRTGRAVFGVTGMDWTEVLASEAENPRARLAAELLASATYASTAARVQAFVEQGGGCRATFFNYRRKLTGGKETSQEPTS